MTVLVQLFSARNFTPWNTVLDLVKAKGFDGVEGFSQNFDEPEAFRELLDNRGLIMPQGHFGLDLLEGEFPKAIQIAHCLGVKTVIAPWLAPDQRPTSSAGWEALSSRLALLSEKVRDEGFEFAWHNHDFEFRAVEGGVIPMDILLDAVPGLSWEADLGWIFRAGLDPVDWLNARSERIIAVHLKDVLPNHDAAPEGGWADLGHGVNDWQNVFKGIAKLPNLKAAVAEHDNPNDLVRFLERWMESYRGLAGVNLKTA